MRRFNTVSVLVFSMYMVTFCSSYGVFKHRLGTQLQSITAGMVRLNVVSVLDMTCWLVCLSVTMVVEFDTQHDAFETTITILASTPPQQTGVRQLTTCSGEIWESKATSWLSHLTMLRPSLCGTRTGLRHFVTPCKAFFWASRFISGYPVFINNVCAEGWRWLTTGSLKLRKGGRGVLAAVAVPRGS